MFKEKFRIFVSQTNVVKEESKDKEGIFTFEINKAEKVCLVVGKGCISFDSSVKAMHTLADDPGFRPDYNIIVDLRDISYHPTYKEVLDIKNNLVFMKTSFTKKVAIVTTGFRMVLAELVSRFSQLKGMTVSAFSDMGAALEWVKE